MNANTKSLKAISHLFFTVLLTMVMTSCGGNDEVGTENMISGSSSKTWKINEEMNAAGDEQDLSDVEKQETLQFYADGRFAMGSGGMLQTGTWSFDQTAKRLTLHFEDEEMTENFDVVKLTDDEMELKADDDSVMKLEVKK